jgi:hypothetical protein
MSWRDRDYAKFTKEEFEAIYGTGDAGFHTTGPTRGTSRSMDGGARRTRRGSGAFRALRLLALAVGGTTALLALAIATGKVNDFESTRNQVLVSTPTAVVPQIQPPLRIAGPVPHRASLITGTRLLQYGSTLTLADSHTPMPGNIVVSGRWGSARWETLAVARGERGRFAFRIPLTRRGVLSLRIAYPDGERAVGTYHVR